MPESTEVVINGTTVVIEHMVTSGELLVSALMTILMSVAFGVLALWILGGRR